MIPTDAEIADELADELMHVSLVPPYRVGIRFDAKAGPCPRPIHKISAHGTVGEIAFSFQSDARRWLRDTLLAGYTVVRPEGRHWSYERSLATRRRLYEHRALTPAERQAIDDDIPF